MNNIIKENINKYENYIYDEDEYTKMEDRYFLKFFSLPPTFYGLSQKHPIYMFLMENAIKTGKKIDEKDKEEAIEIFNVYDKDKEY